MGRWNIRGRGDQLEELVIASNDFYHKHGVCRIDKASTPVKAVQVVDGSKIIEGYFEKKATVDFYGVAQGHYICFDAKQTATSSFPLKNVHEHQLEYMKNVESQDGITFLLVEFTKFGKYFILPFEIIYDYYERAKKGGRKSIPLDVFPEELEVECLNHLRLNYLDAVNRYMDWKEDFIDK